MEGTIIGGCNWCKCSVGGGGRVATLDTAELPPSSSIIISGGLRFVGNGCGPGGVGKVGCI